MKKASENAVTHLLSLFPGQIRVFDIAPLKKMPLNDPASLLHRHFRKPLGEERMKKLVIEIANHLKNQEADSVYSFFYRCEQNESIQADWCLSCGRLNISEMGLPKEVVIFTYDLSLLGENKNQLYTVLENDSFFWENFDKVALLTKREKEIIRLLSAGMNSLEISKALYISVHTVNTHRKNINDKLAIQSFATLIKFAEAFDLTTTDYAR